jgi:oligo-1,6-glucosidase
VLTKWQQGLNWNALYLENHDQPRIVSHYGDDGEYWERSAKMLATMEFTLRGTPFVFEGQEIGMTNFDFTSLSQLKDVESYNIDRLMKKLHIPAALRWKWIRQASRDNSRTPMQWSGEKGAGFTTGTPWIGINGNHVRINYQDQRKDENSILHYYRKMIALRASSETLKYGVFEPLYADNRVMAYRRTLGTEQYTVLLNFSPKPSRATFYGEVVVTNLGIKGYNGVLAPYEAVVLKTASGR